MRILSNSARAASKVAAFTSMPVLPKALATRDRNPISLHLPTTSRVLLLGSSFRINLENVMLPPNRHLPRLRLD